MRTASRDNSITSSVRSPAGSASSTVSVASSATSRAVRPGGALRKAARRVPMPRRTSLSRTCVAVLRTTSPRYPLPGGAAAAVVTAEVRGWPDTATATVKAARALTVGAMGRGFSSPPSASSRPWMTTGVMRPGSATEARMAASTGPSWNHRDRGELEWQVLDACVAEDVAHPGEDLLRPDGSWSPWGQVVQAQHVAVRQPAHPRRERVEAAGGVEAPDEGAHGTAGDADDLVAAFLQDLEDPDVGVPAGAAAPEGHSDAGAAGTDPDVVYGHGFRPCTDLPGLASPGRDDGPAGEASDVVPQDLVDTPPRLAVVR